MLSFSHRRKILSSLSFSLAIILSFFSPPPCHFLSRTLVADRPACTRVRFSNRWGEGKGGRGWGRESARERKRERGERGGGSSNLHIYSFTGIQSSLNSAEFVWMRGHRRRMCVATHELHPLFITLRRAWWSSEARAPHGPSPLSLSFCLYFSRFFFSFFKPRSAPLLFSRRGGGRGWFLWNGSFVAQHCAILNNLARLSAPMQV